MQPELYKDKTVYVLAGVLVIFVTRHAKGFELNHRLGITTEGVSEFHQEPQQNIMTEKIALKFLDKQMIQEYQEKCHRGVFSLFLGSHVSEQDLSNCTLDNEHILISLKHDIDLPFGAYAIVKRIRVRQFQSPNEGNCILKGVVPEFYAFLAKFLGWDKLLPLPEATFARFSLINQGHVYNPEEHTDSMNKCVMLLMNDESSHNHIRHKCPFRCQNGQRHGEL